MANYNQVTFRKEKWKNKVALQKELGLTEDKGKFMIGIVSRLTDQKGFDLVAYVMDQICAEDVQLVVLGTGDEKYENMFRHYGNIMTEFLLIYIIQKICLTKYMLPAMLFLCHHFLSLADSASL